MRRLHLMRSPIGRFVRLRPAPPDPGRSGLAVVAIMRNEAAGVADWARYHLTAGARRLIVYDNGSTDGTAEALRAAVPGEALMLIPWAGDYADDATGIAINRQTLAYAHALMNHLSGFERAAFIDCDEFLVPLGRHLSLMEALRAAAGDHPSLSVPWIMFGSDGREGPAPGPVWEAYRERAAAPAKAIRNFKPVVDPARVVTMGVHACETDTHGWRSTNDAGREAELKARKDEGYLSTRHIQLNHYYTRSRAEFDVKVARGSVSSETPERYASRLRGTWDLIHERTVRDDALPEFLGRIGAGS